MEKQTDWRSVRHWPKVIVTDSQMVTRTDFRKVRLTHSDFATEILMVKHWDLPMEIPTPMVIDLERQMVRRKEIRLER